MPPIQADTDSFWTPGEKHLIKVDPRLRQIIRRVGPCTLSPRKDYFVALCKSIYSQQISTKVAATLFQRFRTHFPGQRPTPARTLELLHGDPEAIKHCGLSRQKTIYLKDLADHFISDRIPVRRLAKMDDHEVIDALVCVNGIGRWTAEMFLMFVLNRPDVLPTDDLGLRDAAKQVYGMKDRPRPKELTLLAEPWRPWRSLATWYLWRRNQKPDPTP